MKARAPRNRTVVLTPQDRSRLKANLGKLPPLLPAHSSEYTDQKSTTQLTLWGDCLALAPHLPPQSVDLLFLDPPYDLDKQFGSLRFKAMGSEAYEEWLTSLLEAFLPCLQETATLYICGDWRSSAAIQRAGSRFFQLRNRITWEREKGRGSQTNWKNASEDIWYFTRSDRYCFEADRVKLKRKVLAPYRQEGSPKDWSEEKEGRFRLTSASNFWSDLTVPFWSMPENTDHPTQKPEKLLAKLLLASTQEGDLVLDPFLGSGTTSVVAKKLNRNFIGIEQEEEFALLALKRLENCEASASIQGYEEGVFWERNALKKNSASVMPPSSSESLPRAQ